MRVFVTVGSTQFDALVTHILSPSFLKLLRECQKVIQVTIQYGRTPLTALVTDEGEFTKSEDGKLVIEREGVQLNLFPFTSTLQECMKEADLIISHAVSNFYRSSSRHSSMSVGSGSILEALRLPRDKHRVLVVVVNETLMDNHQQELAFAMQDYLIPCTCSELDAVIRDVLKDSAKLKPYPTPDYNLFSGFVDTMFNAT